MTRSRAVSGVANGGPRRGRVLIGLAAVLLVLAALLTWLLLRLLGDDRLPEFPRDSRATVMYAGMLPEAGILPGARGVAIGDDRLYVAVADAGAVRTSALDGSDVSTIALEPVTEGVRAYPVDVAALPEGRVAVVDTAGNRVLIVDEDGRVQATITDAGGLAAPTAVAAGGDRVYVADGGEFTIKVYRTDGRFDRTLRANAAPPLNFVGGLALDEDSLYASDSSNARVLEFDADRGASRRSLEGEFQLPRGVATWHGGVLVADVFARTVLVFDENGESSDIIPPEGGDVQLVAPEDVAFDEDRGRAYVSDSVLGKVYVFNLRTAEEASR